MAFRAIETRERERESEIGKKRDVGITSVTGPGALSDGKQNVCVSRGFLRAGKMCDSKKSYTHIEIGERKREKAR